MGARRHSAALAFVLALAPALAAAEAPAQQGLDPQRICAIGPALETLKRADPEGVVVVRHGALVYEHYFGAGSTARAAGTVHEIYAITTNLVALLTGIAFTRGWLNDIDAPVFSLLPEYAALRTPGKERITLRDLLTMTSGLAWPELFVAHDDPANIARRMRRAPARCLRQKGAVRPAWDHGLGVEAIGRRDPARPGRVFQAAVAAARSGQDRPARAEPRPLARAADRLGRLDQGDDDAADPALVAAQRRSRRAVLRLSVVARPFMGS